MKSKLLLSTVLLLWGVSLLGQQFISEQNQWNVLSTVFPGGKSTEVYRIEGDSVFKSNSYKKIWATFDSLSTWQYRGLLRQESGIVWYVHPDDSTERVLYNFNLNAGDSETIVNSFCSPGDSISVSVYEVDTVEYFGIQHKRWHLTNDFGLEDYWVEGIGSLSGPLYSMYGSVIVCPSWDLLCFHNSDTLYYQNENENSCWIVGIDENVKVNARLKPNPVIKGRPFVIEANREITDIFLYNSTGFLIKSIKGFKQHSVTVGTADLNKGLYLIAIKAKGNHTETYKVVVE